MHTQNVKTAAAESSGRWGTDLKTRLACVIAEQRSYLLELCQVWNLQLSLKDEAEEILRLLSLMSDNVHKEGVLCWERSYPLVTFHVVQPWLQAKDHAIRLSACLLGLVMPVIFSDRNRAINHTAAELGTSSASHFVGDRIAAAYADSDYNAADYDWPHSDYHTSAISSDSFDINPATGQTMVGMYDTSGCLYGYSDPVFTDDHHNTNQFSDFDYHNNP